MNALSWVLLAASVASAAVVWYLRRMNRVLEDALWALRDARAEQSLLVQAANERTRRAEAALAVKLRLEAADDRAQKDHVDRMPPSARARAVADLLNKLHSGRPGGGAEPAPVPPPGSGPVPDPDDGGVR